MTAMEAKVIMIKVETCLHKIIHFLKQDLSNFMY